MSTKKYLKYIRLEDSVFRRQFGVKKNTFELRFKIISEKYRNRRKRFSLRFNLIAAIYNLELI